MKLICIKTRLGVDLSGAQLIINNRPYTVGGKAKEEFKDGLLWQWWIILEDS